MEANAVDLEHDARVGSGTTPPLRLTVLGDSTAAGFGLADPDQAWPRQTASELSRRLDCPVDVRVHAVRGHRIATVTDEQVPNLDGTDPDIVLVSVGGNDALGRVAPWNVRRDQRRMVRAIRDLVPQAILVIVGAPRVDQAPVLGPALSTGLAAACMATRNAQRRQAQADGVVLFFLDPLSLDEFGPDGLHASVAAHARAAIETADVLEPLLGPPVR